MSRTDTAANIRHHFLKLLEEKPYQKLSTKEIAEAAGISRQTLYRHYGNKQEIVRAIFDDMFEEFYERAEPHLAKFDYSVAFALNYMAYNVICEHREAFQVLAQNGDDRITYEQLRRYFRRFIGAVLRHLELPPNEDTMEYALDMLAGGAFQVMRRWGLNGMKESPEEMAKVHATFFNGDALTQLIGNQDKNPGA